MVLEDSWIILDPSLELVGNWPIYARIVDSLTFVDYVRDPDYLDHPVLHVFTHSRACNGRNGRTPKERVQSCSTWVGPGELREI